MSGHYTRENLLELLSVIEYANRNKIDALIISYNFEKALNRVEWDVLNLIMEKFNFGLQIRAKINWCYKIIESTVVNNGYTGEWFKLGRSVRQGCPPKCISLQIGGWDYGS